MCGQPRLNYVRVILHIQAEVRFTQCFSESRFSGEPDGGPISSPGALAV